MFLPFPKMCIILKWVVLICFLIVGINYWLHNKSYIFDVESVAIITRNHVGIASANDISVAYGHVLNDLRVKYQEHILPDEDLQWIFINAGGWMGSICLLHASLTEYVLFFGTALDTAGHSGRYWANISDIILTGNFYQWQEGTLYHNAYKAGDTVTHSMGEATSVSWTGGTWMVEYGRGFIPSTLFYALADSFTSTTDFMTVFYIIRVYFKAIFLEVKFCVGDIGQCIRDILG